MYSWCLIGGSPLQKKEWGFRAQHLRPLFLPFLLFYTQVLGFLTPPAVNADVPRNTAEDTEPVPRPKVDPFNLTVLIPKKRDIIFDIGTEPISTGLIPEKNSQDFKRLFGLRAYEGDRAIFANNRHVSLWNLKPHVAYSWRYDSNLLDTATNRLADWYQTVEAGLRFNLGKMTGTSDELHTVFAVQTDYAVAQDWFLRDHQYDSLNHNGRIDVRIGRDAVIFRPYFEGNTGAGLSALASQRAGRVTSTTLTGGLMVNQQWGAVEDTTYCSWGQLDQRSNVNIGYGLWKVYNELGYPLTTFAGPPADSRYTTSSALFVWGSAQDASSNNRSADIRYLLGGVGGRAEIAGNLSFETKIGWENIERSWSFLVGRDVSTVYLNTSAHYDLNRQVHLQAFLGRSYELSQTNSDDNYTDNYFTISPIFKLYPGWQLIPAFNLGSTSSEQKTQTFYLVPSAEVDYAFLSQSVVKMKLEYNESRTTQGPGGDVISWRSTCAVALYF